jgi:Brp/Blh family beta-carotene 15,15'-monooxygenase
MNFPFAWCPLDPVRPNRLVGQLLGQMADRCAVVFCIIGIALTISGHLSGFWQILPLALSVLLFGLPHGALDHLVSLGLAKRRLRPAPLAVVLTLYTLIAASVCVLWIVTPLIAAIGFLVLTVYHWGKADLAFEQLRDTTCCSASSRINRFAHGLLRGLLPIGLPLVAHPESASAFMSTCIGWFQSDASFNYSWVRLPLLILICALWLFDTFRICRASAGTRYRKSRWLVVENVGLAIFFLIVPPLAAVGFYFCGWHGYRHVLRLRACRECRQGSATGARVINLSRFTRQALPFTLIALAGLPALGWFLTANAAEPQSWIALYLVLISALTLPHVCVVEWMDFRQFSPAARESPTAPGRKP